MAKQKSDNYERVEITFSKDSKSEMNLYEHFLKRSKTLGKGKYIKNLIYDDMKTTEK